MPGRKTKLTPLVHATIVAHLRAGAYMRHAAHAAGVSDDAVSNWVKRGTESDEEPYASFAHDVLKAKAEDALRSQRIIDQAVANGDWRAAAWNLERKYPKFYARRSDRLSHASEQTQSKHEP